MADSYKDIIITPNRSNTADPKIDLRGGNSSVNTAITVTVYPDSNGTLSFDGSAGQLFSITNDLSGLLWSVNDVSGIPSAEVYANGSVRLAEFSGNVSIGTATNSSKLFVNGNSTVNGSINVTSTMAAGNTTITGFANISSTLNATGAITQNGNQVLHAGNYTSYAPSLTGSGASGNWSINITGSAGSVDFNNLTNKGSGTGTYTTSGDFRAPIFYDSNDTGYYVDPNGTSVLYGIRATSGFDLATNDVYGSMRVIRNALTTGVGSDGMYIGYQNGNSGLTRIYGGGVGTGDLIKYATYTEETNAFRAPIFYDSANTSFYVDPASTSNLNGLTVVNTITGSINGNAGTVTNGVYTTDSVVTARSTIVYSESSDFNTFTTAGTYRVVGATWVGSTNAPTGAYPYGQLVVTTNGDIVTQFYYSHSTFGHFVRSKFNASDWTAWQEVLSSANYNDFAPTLTGSGASGNWSINITGNAGTVTNGVYTTGNQNISGTKVFTDGIGLDGAGASNDPYGRMSVTRPADANNYSYYGMTRAGQLGAGFGLDASNRFWWGSATAGYAGVASATGMTMTVAGIVTASSDFRAPIFYDSDNTGYYVDPSNASNLVGQVQINGGTAMTAGWARSLYLAATYPVIVFNSNNTKYSAIGVDYSSPASGMYFWVNGSSADISGTGTAALSIDTGNFVTAVGSFRAPIFYDSANTAYYLDPASTGTSLITAGGVYAAGQVRAAGWWGDASASATGLAVEIGESSGRGFVLSYNRDTTNYGPISFEATDFTFTGIDGGYIGINTSVRAPIFYDSANTSFYVDPASTSNLNGLTVASTITGSITGSAGSATNALRIVFNDGPRDLSDRTPSNFARTVNWDFVGAGAGNGVGNYAGVMTFIPWTGTTASTGDSSYQLAFGNQSGVNASGPARLSIRNGIDSTWNAWQIVLTSSNYNDYSPTLTGTGASGTWGISVTGNAATLTNFTTTTTTSVTDENATSAIGYISGISLFGQSDGALYSHVYSGNWKHQIFGDYRTGQLAIRGKNNGTWQSWRTVLDSTNYNSYAPTLTGTGASGTWSISVTGNAGTVTNGVYTTGDQTIGGTKTFSSTISGSINGTASYSNHLTQGFNTNWNTDFSDAPAGSTVLRGDTSTGSATGGPGGTWWFQQNMRHTNGTNLWGVQVAWGWEDNIHTLKTRNVSSGTWSGWVTYLNSNNYNSYAPTLTGTGASGTWSINVTGSAGSVPFNNLTSKTSGTGTYITSGDFRAPVFYDSDNTNYYLDPASVCRVNTAELDSARLRGSIFILNNAQTVFNAVISRQDGDDWIVYGGGSVRAPIFYDNDNTAYYVNPNGSSLVNSLVVNSTLDVYGIHYLRSHLNILNTAGNSWNTVIDRNGGDTWIVYGGNSVRAPIFYDSNNTAFYLDAASTGTSLILGGLLQGGSSAATDVNTANDTGSFSARGNTSTVACMSFHRTGAYAMNMGLGTDNVFRIGGWSASNNAFQMDGSGNLTMLNNVTAYSDARLKKDIVKIENALDKVQQINGYTYTRTDTGSRQSGVIAQEVMKVLPEVVMGSEETNYSVAYGNMVGLLIEAIKEQQEQINRLEVKINSLQQLI